MGCWRSGCQSKVAKEKAQGQPQLSETQKITRPLTGQPQHGRTRRHLALHGDGDLEDEVADALGRAGVDERALVRLGRGGEVAQGRDGVALRASTN